MTENNPQLKTSLPATPAAFLWYITKPYKWGAFITVVLVIASSVISQSLTLFFKWIVEAIERQDVQAALLYGLWYPVAVFVAQILVRLSSVTAALYWFPDSRKYTNDILFNYTTSHSHTYFSNRFSGSLLTKINNIIGAVESLLHDLVWSHLSLAVSLTVSLFLYILLTLLQH